MTEQSDDVMKAFFARCHVGEAYKQDLLTDFSKMSEEDKAITLSRLQEWVAWTELISYSRGTDFCLDIEQLLNVKERMDDNPADSTIALQFSDIEDSMGKLENPLSTDDKASFICVFSPFLMEEKKEPYELILGLATRFCEWFHQTLGDPDSEISNQFIWVLEGLTLPETSDLAREGFYAWLDVLKQVSGNTFLLV